MTCGEHHGVVGYFRVFSQDLLGNGRGGGGEVDVVQVILGDSVAGNDEQIAGAYRNHLRRRDFRYPVADDAGCQAR